jgi:hypothetical protein
VTLLKSKAHAMGLTAEFQQTEGNLPVRFLPGRVSLFYRL